VQLGPDDEVVVVAHEAVGLDAPVVTPRDPPEHGEEHSARRVVGVRGSPVVPSRPNVVDGAGDLFAERVSHAVDGTSPGQPRATHVTPLAHSYGTSVRVSDTGRG